MAFAFSPAQKVRFDVLQPASASRQLERTTPPQPPNTSAIVIGNKMQLVEPAHVAGLSKPSSDQRIVSCPAPRPSLRTTNSKGLKSTVRIIERMHRRTIGAAAEKQEAHRGIYVAGLFLLGAILMVSGGLILGLQLGSLGGVLTFLGALVLGLIATLAAFFASIGHDPGGKSRLNLITIIAFTVSGFSLFGGMLSLGFRLLLLGAGVAIFGVSILHGIPDTP